MAKNRKLSNDIKKFTKEKLYYLIKFRDYHKKGLFPIENEGELLTLISKAQRLVPEIIVMAEQLKKGCDKATVRKFQMLLSNLACGIPDCQREYIMTNEQENICKYCKNINEYLEYRYKKIQDKLGGIFTPFQEQYSGRPCSLQERIKIGNSIIDVKFFNHVFPEDLEKHLKIFRANNITLSNIRGKDPILESFLSEASPDYIIRYMLRTFKTFLLHTPSWIFGSRIALFFIGGGDGYLIPLNQYSSFIVNLPFIDRDIQEWASVIKGEMRLEATYFYRVMVHELTHARDLYNQRIMFSEETVYDKNDKKIVEKITGVSSPINQLYAYVSLLTLIRSEGYATFNEYLSASIYENSLLFSLQYMFMKNRHFKLEYIYDIEQVSRRFKKLYESNLFFTEGFYKEYDKIQSDHTVWHYFYGALVFTCMLIYFLRKELNNGLYILCSDKIESNPKEILNFLSMEFQAKEPIKEFWSLDPKKRIDTLSKKFLLLAPYDLLTESGYTLFTSPELLKKIMGLSKLFSMDILQFPKYGAKACEFCGFKNHIFWSIDFFRLLQSRAMQYDEQLLKKRISLS